MRVLKYRALVLAVASALPIACGSSSPSAPAPPAAPSGTFLPASLSGIWRGNLKVVSCSVGPSICSSEYMVAFQLRVVAGGPGYLGTFELESLGTSDAFADVTGQSQPDGSVLFTGSRVRIPNNSSTFEVRRLLVRVDAAAGLTGEIDVRQFTGRENSLVGRVLSATYEPFLPGSTVSGTWSGMAIIRACSGYCPSFQTVGQRVRIWIAIGQSGAAVSGQLQLSAFSCDGCWLPISGTMSGSRLSLSSPVVSRISSYGDRTLHLESFEGSFDQLSRIVGGFVYASDSRIAISPFNVSYRIECEILWLKPD